MEWILLQGNGTADPVGAVQGFWDDYGTRIKTLSMWAGGILVYGLLVNAFYQIISKRVMFARKERNGEVHVGGPGAGFVYLMVFPLFSFLFFILLSAALIFLGGDDGRATTTVFTLAMAIVLAVRVAAYLSEPTSHDIAKMLPLGLLGVFLVDASLVTDYGPAFARLLEIFDHVKLLGVYLLIVVVVEYLLRSVFLAVRASRRHRGLRPAREA